MSCNCNTMMATRSAQAAYNDATQAFVEAGTTINLLGTQITDTGDSIKTTTSAFSVVKSGVYRISYDITFSAAAGTVVVQLYDGTTALPCAVDTIATVADQAYTVHIETVIPLRTCAVVSHDISAHIGGEAGTVTHVCANAVRIA